MRDVNQLGITKTRVVLRKFSDDELTDLKEVIVTENEILIETWKKGDSRPSPED